MLLTDPVSCLTHLAGAIGAAAFGFALVRRSACTTLGDPANRTIRVVAMSVFVASAVVLLLASALFHAMPAGTAWRTVTQRVDHAAIFILIAGTFTPIHAILFRGWLRWGVLAFIWGAAVAGLVLKVVFFDSLPEWAGVGAYLALGWVGAFSMAITFRRHSLPFVSPLVLGGLAYSVGALCEFTGQPTLVPGAIESHEVFHIAVLVGLGSMWMFIRRLSYGVPERTRARKAHHRKHSANLEHKPPDRRTHAQADSVVVTNTAQARAENP